MSHGRGEHRVCATLEWSSTEEALHCENEDACPKAHPRWKVASRSEENNVISCADVVTGSLGRERENKSCS